MAILCSLCPQSGYGDGLLPARRCHSARTGDRIPCRAMHFHCNLCCKWLLQIHAGSTKMVTWYLLARHGYGIVSWCSPTMLGYLRSSTYHSQTSYTSLPGMFFRDNRMAPPLTLEPQRYHALLPHHNDDLPKHVPITKNIVFG